VTYRMTFRGAEIPAEPGQSVGAALVAAGILDWRTTRKEGRPRGLFCGIGVCYDCLITVDGARAERACLIPAADGMRLGDALDTGDALETGDGPDTGDAPGDDDRDGAAQHAEEDGDDAAHP